MENQWIPAHIAGATIYNAITGTDTQLARLGLVLRNSLEGASPDDTEPGSAAHAALSLPVMDESELSFHETEAGKWTRAILEAAHSQNWPVLDARTLAPLSSPSEVDCAIVETQRIADWIAARIPDPATVEAICAALGQIPERAEVKYTPSRHRQQEEAILSELRKRGYEPRALPKPPAGKPGVKSEIRAAFPYNVMTKSVFKAAWDRLRSAGDIADQ